MTASAVAAAWAALEEWARDLGRSYRAHHVQRPTMLERIGVVGVLAFSLLYLARFTGKLPPRYDDLPFRSVAILLCAGLAARRYWPGSLAPLYLPYSYFAVFYCLAVFLPFTVLQNQGSTATVVNMVVGVGLIVLLADWRNAAGMLLAGYAASLAMHWIVATAPHVPFEFLFMWVPMCIVLAAGGCIFRYLDEKAAQQRERLHAALAGSIAHEVRTPLAQTRHALDQLQETIDQLRPLAGAPNDVFVNMEQTLATGRQAIQRGLQAIEITLQQLNGRPPAPRSFSILSAAGCVQKALAEYAYEDLRQRDAVTLDVREDFRFRGDETAFVLVVFNLLRNALYYLPIAPWMQVTIEVRRGPAPCIRFRDTGPGIAASRLARLFEEFSPSDKSSGTGLGLSFCRRIMISMGGDIRCESVEGEYTLFTLSFPEVSEASHASEPELATSKASAAAEHTELANRTVLVVDDSASNRRITKAYLTRLGIRVIEAEHAQRALDMLQAGLQPLAVLMDMNMPGLSGLDAVRQLRARNAGATDIPVVGLSANSSPEWEEAALAAGVDRYLAKPIDPEALRSALVGVASAS